MNEKCKKAVQAAIAYETAQKAYEEALMPVLELAELQVKIMQDFADEHDLKDHEYFDEYMRCDWVAPVQNTSLITAYSGNPKFMFSVWQNGRRGDNDEEIRRFFLDDCFLTEESSEFQGEKFKAKLFEKYKAEGLVALGLTREAELDEFYRMQNRLHEMAKKLGVAL